MDVNNISLQRALELKNKTIDYRNFKHRQMVVEEKRRLHYLSQKGKLINLFDATEADWSNWKWQVNHRINSLEVLKEFIPLTEEEISTIFNISKLNRFAISPYYLSLIVNKDDPIKMLSVPSINEMLCQDGELDPMNEKNTNPSGSITRRYPDRLIVNVTNQCAMYCRHCQRRRLIDEKDTHTSREIIDESIEYIRNNPEIRDVLLTGGDALLLPNDSLEYILKKLRSIPTVEIIRIGSRTPVTMPMRITNDLVNMLKKYHPIYLNTHFNHHYEVTEESKKACETLVNAGISVGNQAVLLKGVNNNPFTMTYLNQQLLTARVRPYYIFHAKNVKGTRHFIPTVKEGLEIMEFMRGNTSGLAIPTYIMNAPMGLGKVPLLPDYITKLKDGQYRIRTWENKTFTYTDK